LLANILGKCLAQIEQSENRTSVVLYRESESRVAPLKSLKDKVILRITILLVLPDFAIFPSFINKFKLRSNATLEFFARKILTI
jgi:hypothetical protein